MGSDRLFDDRILGIKCDVSKSLEVDHLIRSTIDKFKSIDILVNNAGIVFVKKLIDTSEVGYVPKSFFLL